MRRNHTGIRFRDSFATRGLNCYLIKYENNKTYIGKITWQDHGSIYEWPECDLTISEEDVPSMIEDLLNTFSAKKIKSELKADSTSKDSHISNLKEITDKHIRIIENMVQK